MVLSKILLPKFAFGEKKFFNQLYKSGLILIYDFFRAHFLYLGVVGVRTKYESVMDLPTAGQYQVTIGDTWKGRRGYGTLRCEKS